MVELAQTIKLRQRSELMWGWKPMHPGDDNPNHDPLLPLGTKTPCNDQFHVWHTKANEYWNFGANRSGKTELGMAFMCAFCAGEQPVWSKIRKPPVDVWVAGPTWDSNAIGVLLAKIRKLARLKDLRGGDFDSAWNAGEGILHWENSSTTQLKTYSQPLGAWGGKDIDAIFPDEHIPIDYYREAKRGLVDRNGFLFCSMTPELGSIMWERRHVMEYEDDPDILVSKFTIYGNPYLSAGGIRELERACTDDASKQVKLYGEFVALAGLVYPMWNRKNHVIQDYELPMDWPRVFVIDCHLKEPSAMIWGAWSPKGEFIVYRCAKVAKTIPELRRFIRAQSMKDNIALWLGDETERDEEGERNIYDQQSIITQLNQGPESIPIERVAKPKGSVWASIMEVRRMLTLDPLSKEPKLKVFHSCQGVIDEIEEYQFLPSTIADERTARERIRKVFNHYMDDIRYAVAAGQIGGQNLNLTSSLNGCWD